MPLRRDASKLGNVDGFGADPTRVEQAGGLNLDDFQKNKIGARYEKLRYRYNANNQTEVAKDSTMDSEEAENLIFFYHPDHLGSTTLVTDIDGKIIQHVAYIPYGEVFIEERDGNWNTPYLFNAKELDEETGLYYYGARYLNPKDTRWLSVDPMWEKYVGMSPYNYCAGNPVIMVDPDGRFGIIFAYLNEPKDKNKHQGMTNQAMKNIGLNLNYKQRHDLWNGTFFADATNFYNDYHFDNRSSEGSYSQIESHWAFIHKNMSEFSGKDKLEDFGIYLHNAQDFYAHSNYIELYVEYYQKNGGDMSNFDPNNIPTYDQASQEFKDFMKEGDRLYTGTWKDSDNEKIPFISGSYKNDPRSHYNLNKDSNESIRGGKKIPNTKYTYHDAAVKVATKHTEQLLKKYVQGK